MNRHGKDSWFSTYIKSKPLEVTLQVVGVGVLLLNIWLSSKLAPMAQNLSLLTEKVQALENLVPKSVDDHTDIQVIKTQVMSIKQDVTDIKERLFK